MGKHLGCWLAGVAALLCLARPAAADLCAKCKGKMFITSVGKCVECGARTSSGAFKLCPACSRKLGQCQACRAALKPKAAAKKIVVDMQANGTTVKAAVGQQVVVQLKGNPTTGYSWAVAELKGDAVKQAGKVAYVPRKVPRRIVGSGGAFVATFDAVKAGQAVLTMVYARPWEKGKPPAKTFKLTIQVAAAPPKKA